MSFLINPYAFLAAGGDYESIATVSVGSGGASSIEFTSIPGTYQHLQVRWVGRSSRASNTRDNFRVRLGSGSVDSGSNYAHHRLEGSQDTASASAGTSATGVTGPGYMPGSTATANAFGAGVMDILDYSSTSKYTTIRSLAGVDNNGGYYEGLGIGSGLWMNSAAVDVVSLTLFNGSWVQYSTAALFGVKA